MTAFITRRCLLPRRLLFCALQQCRPYTLSRFPNRTTGFGRNFRGDNISRKSQLYPLPEDRPRASSKFKSVDNSQFLRQNTGPTTDPRTNLKRLLLNNDELIVTRQLEMLNIFIGFEQSNRYVIMNQARDVLGYIVEEPRGFLSMFARQMFRTHRPFRALVMDAGGSSIFWIRRPFSWINSRMFVQRPRDDLASGPEGELVLDTFAEVQQEWHLWRRRYDLFLRSTSLRVLTLLESDHQPLTTTGESHFNQFARIDEGLWAWSFVLRDAHGRSVATVNRAFRGLGRELFTDTGQYTVSFRALDEQNNSSNGTNGQILHKPNATRDLAVDERALVLATAVNIDYDYFSRHSEGGHGFGFWWTSGE